MKKLTREIHLMLRRNGVNILEYKNVRGHNHYTLEKGGVVRKITTSNTPARLEITVMNVEQDIKRYFP